MTDPYQSGSLTRQPFSRNNSSVTTPMYCACTRNPLGAYAAQPFCHGSVPPSLLGAPDALNADEQQIEAQSLTQTFRSPQQTLAFGPEVYQGHYGMAYNLRFPDYGGQTYQYQQCRGVDGVFGPCPRCLNPSGVPLPTIPPFNTAAGALNGNGPFVILGSKTNPYFHVYNAAPSAAPRPAPLIQRRK